MAESTYYHYRSPYGMLTIATDGEALTLLHLGAITLDGVFKPHELTNRASTEVLEYLAGKRRIFELPLAPAGSAFERRVWDEVAILGYEETVTMRALAERLGLARSYRQVGVAVNRNPIAIVIPTHRVVAETGHARRSAPDPAIDEALLRLERETQASA